MDYQLVTEVDRLREENERLRAALTRNDLVARLIDKTAVKGLDLHHEALPFHEGLLIVVRAQDVRGADEMTELAETIEDKVHRIGPKGMQVAVMVLPDDVTVDAFLVKR